MDNKLNELLGIIEGTQISADGLQSLLRIQSANTKMEMMEMLTKSAIESKKCRHSNVCKLICGGDYL